MLMSRFHFPSFAFSRVQRSCHATLYFTLIIKERLTLQLSRDGEEGRRNRAFFRESFIIIILSTLAWKSGEFLQGHSWGQTPVRRVRGITSFLPVLSSDFHRFLRQIYAPRDTGHAFRIKIYFHEETIYFITNFSNISLEPSILSFPFQFF